MLIRPLTRDETVIIWTIDRSEVHHHVYHVQHGELVLTSAYFSIPGWAPRQGEEETPQLYACFDCGGTSLSMFNNDQLVGVAVVDTVPLGEAHDHVQLKELYVSRTYRQQAGYTII
jgi:predicted N-acetyltransferase YhbS